MTDDAANLKDRAVALHEAVYKLYTAIKETKQMVGEERSRPRAILRQLQVLEASLDTIYTEACVQIIGRIDMTKIAQELQRAHDQLLDETETAYQDGWQAGWDEALSQVIENAPGDSGVVVAWLVHTLLSDASWREPAWEGVIALIREAQGYLAANSET